MNENHQKLKSDQSNDSRALAKAITFAGGRATVRPEPPVLLDRPGHPGLGHGPGAPQAAQLQLGAHRPLGPGARPLPRLRRPRPRRRLERRGSRAEQEQGEVRRGADVPTERRPAAPASTGRRALCPPGRGLPRGQGPPRPGQGAARPHAPVLLHAGPGARDHPQVPLHQAPRHHQALMSRAAVVHAELLLLFRWSSFLCFARIDTRMYVYSIIVNRVRLRESTRVRGKLERMIDERWEFGVEELCDGVVRSCVHESASFHSFHAILTCKYEILFSGIILNRGLINFVT